ncbi:hypothetical protein [Erythrobacter sp. HL-111]|uniref:hypothetical protein n=1 Tax=Erythrobacter sp. HL-111 TaxID=1798193 RepID=UPI0006DADA59|nr:hypothetical protein [Erythrobacter sp. HL-111]KPP91152.1 MAG: hypothetical protein HLUCCO15_08705 [Erythrobacteraceae bacterium HL-111]SDS45584.1 hypothetical protein SAMN04515621_1598 [Erythrobacter sp. HL-111]
MNKMPLFTATGTVLPAARHAEQGDEGAIGTEGGGNRPESRADTPESRTDLAG